MSPSGARSRRRRRRLISRLLRIQVFGPCGVIRGGFLCLSLMFFGLMLVVGAGGAGFDL